MAKTLIGGILSSRHCITVTHDISEGMVTETREIFHNHGDGLTAPKFLSIIEDTNYYEQTKNRSKSERIS